MGHKTLCAVFVLLAVGLIFVAAVAFAATQLIPEEQGPGGRTLYFWSTSQSWPGGEQADARLDKPVKAWYAAIPIGELFTSLEKQTGVHLACWPAGDDNERICVTIYLNPERAPMLREVMAQLAWVLDCSFACTGDGESRNYYLLRSSLGDNVLTRLQEEGQQALAADVAEAERIKNEAPDLLRAKLEEYRQALSLSPAQLAKKYPTRLPFGPEHNAEGYLLLNMVNPAQRAATQFVLSLSPADLDAVLSNQRLTRKWNEWSPQQRTLLKTAFTQVRLPSGAVRVGPMLTDITVYINMGGLSGISLRGSRKLNNQSQGPDEERVYLRTAVVRWDNGLYNEQWLDISRGLGEVRNERDAEAFRGKLARADQNWNDEYNRRWRERLAKQETLSPAAAVKLSSVLFTFPRFTSYPTWLLLEAVARRSQMNIISDCFYAAERQIRTQAIEDSEMWKGSKTANVSALDMLRLICQHSASYPYVLRPDRNGRLRLVGMSHGPQGWEWGDAGTFLHFRSARRDIWRGSLLPHELFDRLDRALEPALASSAKAVSASKVIHLPFDLTAYRDFGRRVAQLPPLPWTLGGSVIYGDPSAKPGQIRQALRSLALSVLRADNFDTGIYAFVATLSDGQIAQLQTDGIAWSSDLKANQQAALQSTMYYAKQAGLSEEDVPKVILRVQRLTTIANQDAHTPYSYLHLQFLLKNKIIYETPIGLDGLRLGDLPALPELPIASQKSSGKSGPKAKSTPKT